MTRIDKTIDELNTKFGVRTAGRDYGRALPQRPRIPTGIVALDIAIGGGLPMNRATIIRGPEGTGKTTIALKAIAQHQRMFAGRACVFVDLEGTTADDLSWASRLGVDVEKMVMAIPDNAESASDVIWSLVQAEDVGLLVVDSVATMATKAEMAKDADESVVGGAAGAVGRLVKKLHGALRSSLKRVEDKEAPTIILVNQEREKIGVSYGDPTILPGGKGQRYFASLDLRLYAKDVDDKAISKELSPRKKVKVTVKRNKIPIFAKSCEFEMAVVEHPDLAVGECVGEWNVVRHYLLETGLMTRVGSQGVAISLPSGRREFRTQKEVWEWLRGEGKLPELQQYLLATMQKSAGVPALPEAPPNEEVTKGGKVRKKRPRKREA